MRQIYNIEPEDNKVVRRVVLHKTRRKGERQCIIEFTDDSFFCVTSRLDDGQAWIATSVMSDYNDADTKPMI